MIQTLILRIQNSNHIENMKVCEIDDVISKFGDELLWDKVRVSWLRCTDCDCSHDYDDLEIIPPKYIYDILKCAGFKNNEHIAMLLLDKHPYHLPTLIGVFESTENLQLRINICKRICEAVEFPWGEGYNVRCKSCKTELSGK